MPTGPQGQKRPSDPIACAVTVAKIATRQMPEPSALGRPRRPQRKAAKPARPQTRER